MQHFIYINTLLWWSLQELKEKKTLTYRSEIEKKKKMILKPDYEILGSQEKKKKNDVGTFSFFKSFLGGIEK